MTPSPRRTAAWVLLSALALLAPFASAASSAPSLIYPLQLQRPPVARVNQTWAWTLLPETFNSSSGATVTLSTRSLPSWASFDATTATFSGTPQAANLGATVVTVQANATGAARGKTDRFTLLVSDSPEPYVALSIATQLPSASSMGDGATYTLDGALKVPPQWSFSLGFQQYTIADEDDDRIYYTAYETGTTSLPAWMVFDNRTCTFDGIAPSQPGEYSFSLFGSNVFGYGDVEQVFKLSVAQHSFELLGALPALNTSEADQINYTVPIDSLYVDNVLVSTANLSTVAVDLTNASFFSFDNLTRLITGTTPAGLAPVNLTLPVTFVDSYGDTIQSSIALVVLESLFVATALPALNVTTSANFTDDMRAYVTSTVANYSAVISPASANSWILFDPVTLVLSGSAPSTAQTASVTFSAVDLLTGLQSQATLQVNVAIPSATSSGSTGPTDPTTGAGAASTSGVTKTPFSHHSGLSTAQKLGIGLSLGILAALILLGLLAFCCYRKVFGEGEGERRMRRSGSSRVLQNDPDPFAAVAEAGSPPQTPMTPVTLVGSEHAGEKGGKEWADQFEDGPEPDAEAEAAGAGGAGALAVHHSSIPMPASTKTDTPKRFNFMGMFGRGSSAENEQPRPTGQGMTTSNSLYALGIASPRQHNIIVVTDELAGGTYAPRGDSDSSHSHDGVGETDLERSSTWASGASSSLFYSEHSDRDPSGLADSGGLHSVRSELMVRTSESLPRNRNRTETEQSVPRQRRDFLPLPNRTTASGRSSDASSSARSPSPSPSPSGQRRQAEVPVRRGDGNGGIRIVVPMASETFSTLPSGEDESEFADEESDRFNSTMFQGGVPMRAHRPSDSFGSDSHLDTSSSNRSSLASVPAPVIRPFGNERSASYSTHSGSAHASQTALNTYNNYRNSAHEDAFEGDALEALRHEDSGVYRDSSMDSPTTSAVFFASPKQPHAAGTTSSRERTTYSDLGSGRTRAPGAFSALGRHAAAAGQGQDDNDVHRMALTCNEPFRFVPVMNPPPAVSVSSSPSRSRSHYSACLDIPGRPPLPQWLSFDPKTFELHGQPRRLDMGSVAIIIVERKMPGSPTRQGPTRVEEVVVARYILEVRQFDEQDDEEEDEGELRIVTY